MAAVREGFPQMDVHPLTSADNHNLSNASLAAGARPDLIRRDTDQFLSYYHSEHAGQSHDDNVGTSPTLQRRSSLSSNSSSEYSSESLERKQDIDLDKAFVQVSQPARPVHSQHTRRPSVPSPESVDRRRLAIVELDNGLPPSVTRRGSDKLSQSGVSSASALLSRRGLHVDGLALVAPPDASPSSYTNLTPPPTAPVVVGVRQGTVAPSSSVHIRSASEAIGWSHLRHKSSRDVGIVGTGVISISSEPVVVTSPPRSDRIQSYSNNTSELKVPIFQTPSKSRSPSPAPTHTLDLSESHQSDESVYSTPMTSDRAQVTTPAIGEGKDIGQPVVGPIVLGIGSNNVIRRLPMQPKNDVALSPSSHSSMLSHSPSTASSYLLYQPGTHSTAGPLPPPPAPVLGAEILRRNPSSSPPLPPPRPPRLRTPLPMSSANSPRPSSSRSDLHTPNEPLQLPQSVSDAQASRGESRPELKRVDTSVSTASSKSTENSERSTASGSAAGPNSVKSVHKREGAFPPSANTSSPEHSPHVDISSHPVRVASPEATDLPDMGANELANQDTSSIEEDRHRRSAFELAKETSWISLKETNGISSPNGKALPLPDKLESSLPSPPPPPKTGRGLGEDDARLVSSSHGHSSNPFKSTLNNLSKRFSALPRTPSSLSMRSSSHTDSTPRSSRTPSPAHATTPRARQHRVIDPWPDAMQFRDISTMQNPSERALAYAQKIRELSMCDTGLSQWLIASQQKANGNRSARNSAAELPANPATPSTREFAPQPRHTSHGSTSSEVTFPIRADAYKATDLMMTPSDDLSLTKIPPSALPYPSLAINPPLRTSNTAPSTPRSYQMPLSTGPPRSNTGFFASIGRKASLRKDRAPASPASPTRVLTKRGHPVSPPRPVQPQIHSAPTIPGGPRAQPGRMQRAKTISIAPAPVSAPLPPPPVSISRSDTRSSLASRRPSLFHRTTATQPPPVSGPEFEQQVDKLADLLPHADRTVLAGYLRRAGQDILAIGQYLEDEKKGIIRYD